MPTPVAGLGARHAGDHVDELADAHSQQTCDLFIGEAVSAWVNANQPLPVRRVYL